MASSSEIKPEASEATPKPLDILEQIAKELNPEDLMAAGKVTGILLFGFLKSMDAKDSQIKILIYILTGLSIFLAAAAVGLQMMVP